MSFQIVTIPCLQDNYAYLVHDPVSHRTALVDAPEAAPILEALSKRDWTLDQIWITHHHWDHIEGVEGILAQHPAQVIGACADAHRLPKLDLALADQDRFQFSDQEVTVLDVSGHTQGHIAFYLPNCGAFFTADSLMALGCGRLFEGSAEQMHASLQKTKDMPDETLIYSGHEYTQANAAFALSIDPDNKALQDRAKDVAEKRKQHKPTVPSSLKAERDTNPFLRAWDPKIRANLNMTQAPEVEVFREIRARKDRF